MKITQHSPTVTIIEQDACRRSILFEDKRYFLSMPPIIFFIKHTKSFKIDLAYGFFNINKKLYDLPFYNIFFDGKICMGKTKRKFDSLEDLVDGFLKSFWSSKFTDEASASVRRYITRDSICGDYSKWEEKTKKNPKWIPFKSNLIKISCGGEDSIEIFKTEYTK